MTRGQQTAIIVVAMTAMFGIFMATQIGPDENDRYKPCWQLFGEDTKCKAEIAAARLMGKPVTPDGEIVELDSSFADPTPDIPDGSLDISNESQATMSNNIEDYGP